MTIRVTLLCFLLIALLPGCVNTPEGIEPVRGFDINRYLGKWYEIARLDHSFERGLNGVTAEYSLRDDGGVKVINRGFLAKKNRWKSAEGRAYFAGDSDVGCLKVSFFRPFYGAYVVFDLDREGYRYAFVTSSNRSYLWLLSRTPAVSNEVREKFLAQAVALGFDTNKLIFVHHAGL